MKIDRKVIALLFFLVQSVSLQSFPAEETRSEVEKEPLEIKQKAVNVIYPIAFYSPETRIGAGAHFSHIFRAGKKSPSLRPSRIMPMLIYTQNNQIKAEIRTDLYLNNGSHHIRSWINYKNYPDAFFGIGNHTDLEDKEDYTRRSWELFFRFEKQVKAGLYLGGQYHFQNWTVTEHEEGGWIGSGEIPGDDRGTVSGLGVLVSWDTRNHLFYPRRGDFFSLRYEVYNKALGSTFDFSVLRLDLRKYFPVFSRHVLALQAVVESRTGTAPFHMLAELGGADIMRGYFKGRYRDNHMLALQGEYRFHLFWRIGMTLFGGIGQVAERWSLFRIGDTRFSAGFGIRYLFNKKEHINARMDVGFGDEKTRVYMDAPEAF